MANKRKKNNSKAIVISILAFITFIIGAVQGYFEPYDDEKEQIAQNTNLANYYVTENQRQNQEENEIVTNQEVQGQASQIYFIDTGQSDCSLIIDNGTVALIDTGDTEHKEKVLSFLQEKGIKKIDYLFATHPHEDHIGRMSYIIDNLEVGNIIMPKIATTSTVFANVLTSIENKGLKVTAPQKGDTFSIGLGTIEILTDPIEDKSNLNKASPIMLYTSNGKRVVFTRDAEKENEEQVEDIGTVDILKVGHHGSTTSSSDAFLQILQPKYSIIEVGENNSYGHPKEAVLKRLEKYGQIYRTDLKGTISVTLGETITFEFEK